MLNNQSQYTGYYNPYMYNNLSVPQYHQVAPAEQTYYSAGYHLKGRPVASYEEARAAQIDFDGSLHVFTDIGNKKIYTKQINLDGTASIQTYALVENPNVDNNANHEMSEYVTKTEFNQALSQLHELINPTKPVAEKKSLSF